MTYDDLVTAATVGLSRRPLPIAGLSGPAAGHADVITHGDAADALLDAAALHVAARRAGLVPPQGVAPPRRWPPTRHRRSSAPGGAAVAVGRRGYRPAGGPPAGGGRRRLYRAPSDRCSRSCWTRRRGRLALRPAVAATLGSRGQWLAAHRPDWARVSGVRPAPGQGTASDAVAGDSPSPE